MQENQPASANSLGQPQSMKALTPVSPGQQGQGRPFSCLDGLLGIVQQAEVLMDEQPEVLAWALHALDTIWRVRSCSGVFRYEVLKVHHGRCRPGHHLAGERL